MADKKTALSDARAMRSQIEAVHGNLIAEIARIASHMPEEQPEHMAAKVNMLEKAAKYLYPQVKATEISTGDVDSIGDVILSRFKKIRDEKHHE